MTEEEMQTPEPQDAEGQVQEDTQAGDPVDEESAADESPVDEPAE